MRRTDRAALTRRRACLRLAGTLMAVGLTGSLSAQPATVAPAPDAARQVVASLHAALIDAAAGEADAAARYDALLPVVRTTHNLPFIAELTIRRQWRELEPDARAAFVAAFERLSVATYASRFAAVGPDTFRIVASQPLDDGRVEVSAEIVRREQDNVALDYVLQPDGEAWRIVNILADGVSDLALKRAQYQRVFRDGGTIQDLIRSVRDEADAL